MKLIFSLKTDTADKKMGFCYTKYIENEAEEEKNEDNSHTTSS